MGLNGISFYFNRQEKECLNPNLIFTTKKKEVILITGKEVVHKTTIQILDGLVKEQPLQDVSNVTNVSQNSRWSVLRY